MKEQTHEDPRIVAAAERQMHSWALTSEIEDRAARQQRIARGLKYVVLSREAGAEGSEIGRAVGEKIGWPVYDRNLLEHVANRFRVSRSMLDLVDETRSNWVYDVLGTWMDREIVPHEKYVTYLSRALLAIARRGNGVFVGRGAQFLLPRQELLAVRIVAAPEYRVKRMMDRLSIDEADARRLILEVDAGRHEFALRFFHHDIADPHLYDLVISVDRCGLEGAVHEIVALLDERMRTQASVTPQRGVAG